VGRGGLAALAAGSAVLADATRNSVKLESALAQLRKTSGFNAEEMESFKGEVAGLATSMAGVRLDDLLEIATIGGRLGVAKEGLAAFTKHVGRMKVAMNDIPAEQLAQDTARILNVFGLGIDQALSFGSALNRMDDSSTASGQDILDLTKRLSGAGRAMGFSAAETVALSAAIKDAGISNEVAGTAFSQLFFKMAKDTAAFAKVAGVSADEFAATFSASPMEALQQLTIGLQRFDKAGAANALSSLGLEGARVSASLLQLGGTVERIPGFIAEANAQWRTHSSILTEVEIQGQTTRAALDLLANNYQLTSAALGDVLTPALKEFAGLMGTVAGDIRAGLGDQSSAVTAWRNGLVEAVKTAGVVFRNFGDLVERTALEAKLRLAKLTDVRVERVPSGEAIGQARSDLGKVMRGEAVVHEAPRAGAKVLAIQAEIAALAEKTARAEQERADAVAATAAREEAIAGIKGLLPGLADAGKGVLGKALGVAGSGLLGGTARDAGGIAGALLGPRGAKEGFVDPEQEAKAEKKRLAEFNKSGIGDLLGAGQVDALFTKAALDATDPATEMVDQQKNTNQKLDEVKTALQRALEGRRGAAARFA
jgi:TP901 family phage tail tape measure protein